MKSKIYRLNGKQFRYNFENSTVQYIQKAAKETVRREEMRKQSHEEGNLCSKGDNEYIVLDSIGLSRENWENLEARKEYISAWCNDLDEEMDAMVDDFVRYEFSYLL